MKLKRKIALFGLGISNQAVLRFIEKRDDFDFILINQGEPSSWGNQEIVLKYADICFSEASAAKLLDSVDEVIVSPGISPNHKLLKNLDLKKCMITNEIEFAYRYSDIPIFAITGTNGKTTTATMTAELLEKMGFNPFLGGNIGVPFIESIGKNYDCAVLELSSFQLETLKTFKADIAVLLNITENHMERYDSLDDYIRAKMHIFDRQLSTNLAIVPRDFSDQVSKNRNIKVQSIKTYKDYDYSKSKLIGTHNKENFSVAISIAQNCYHVLGKTIDDIVFKKSVQEFINEFRGVNHRLEYIGSDDSLSFYNDSKSTNTASLKAALSSFDEADELILIIGGKLRSEETSIHHEIDFSICNKIYFFGEAGKLLNKKITHQNKILAETLEDIIKDLKSANISGKVLFSPAHPSFDQYQNYIKRGEHFVELVQDFLKD